MYIVTSYTAQDRQLHVEQFRTWLSPNLLLHGYTHHAYIQTICTVCIKSQAATYTCRPKIPRILLCIGVSPRKRLIRQVIASSVVIQSILRNAEQLTLSLVKSTTLDSVCVEQVDRKDVDHKEEGGNKQERQLAGGMLNACHFCARRSFTRGSCRRMLQLSGC